METLALLLVAGLLAAAPDAAPSRCAVPDAPASVIRAVKPDLAPLGGERHVAGVVRVLVSLDPQGRVVDTRIDRSSSQILNRAALDAATKSTYQPALHDCMPVSSKYLFSVFIDSL